MALESLENRINITQLSVEQPKVEKPVLFDQEHDLDEKTWQSMLEQLAKEKDDMVKIIDMAESLVILAPERREQLPSSLEVVGTGLLNITDKPIEVSAATKVDVAFNEDFSDTMCTLKTLFPEKVHQLSLDDQTHDKLINLYDFLKSRRQDEAETRKVLRLAASIKFLFPQFGDEWSEITKRGTEVDIMGTEVLDRLAVSKKWGQFAFVSRQLRYLFPEDRLDASNVAWEGMRAALERRRNKDWLLYAELAANMKVLTAEKVTITEQGLELVMPTAQAQLAQPIPQMPEIKNF
jgi:hypothetical protein